jgi:hypothetical protein
MINSGGDFGKVSNNKKPIKCYVKESFPHFLVTDNFFYVAAYFTRKAVDDFKSRHSNVNITDLKSRVITISDWTLEMNRVNSSDVFTSYGGIEVRLVVKAFSVQAKSDITLSRHPVNIFRDQSIKTAIQHYHHGAVANAVSGAKASMPEIGSKGSSVVSFASGSNFSAWGFRDGKSATVDINSIFKQEKGSLPKSPSSSGKARVLGGPSKKSKGVKKPKASGVGKTVNKLMKSATPGRKSVAKKSTARIGKSGNMRTPGDSVKPGTARVSSQKDFNKMINFLKKNKK